MDTKIRKAVLFTGLWMVGVGATSALLSLALQTSSDPTSFSVDGQLVPAERVTCETVDGFLDRGNGQFGFWQFCAASDLVSRAPSPSQPSGAPTTFVVDDTEVPAGAVVCKSSPPNGTECVIDLDKVDQP